MRKHLKSGTCALAGLVFCIDVLAIAPDPAANRYQAIPERNPFGLKPAPIPPIVDPPQPPLPKLILTGITTILGKKLALMMALPPGNTPGQSAKEESLILTEGQRQGNVEVLNIDEKSGSVRVNNSGSIITLTFEKDGAKLPSIPPPPTTLGGLTVPTNATATSPTTAPTALPGRGATHKLSSFPTRAIRSSNATEPGQTPASANPVTEPGSSSVPSVANPAPVNLPAGLTPEEQAIVLQLQQHAASPSGTGSASQTVVPGGPMPPVTPQ